MQDVRTTLNLPDDLMRAVKMRAVEENRTLQDTIAELLRRGLGQRSQATSAVRKRVRLPLVHCVHEARPDDEMTPERIADVLLEDDVEAHGGSLR